MPLSGGAPQLIPKDTDVWSDVVSSRRRQQEQQRIPRPTLTCQPNEVSALLPVGGQMCEVYGGEMSEVYGGGG